VKIYLIFPQKDGQTGLFIKRAFMELGHEVFCFDPKEENLNYAFGGFADCNPDMVFCSRTPGLALPIQRMKFYKTGIVTACWNVDKRDSIKEFGKPLMELFGAVDILYTIAKGNIEEYRKCFPRVKVLHLQQGCDPKTHHPEELTAEDHAKYDCDVMFAGDYESLLHHGRKELMERLRSMAERKLITLKIFGGRNKIFDSEHNKACQCAKICIGHNGWAQLPVSMSVRDYKIMAAGGFLLTEYCPQISEWFGYTMPTYKNDIEMRIHQWLSSDYWMNQRNKISTNCMALVHAKHKYIDRMAQVIKDVEEWVSTHTRS
jgi:spore maturation protein CgeB